MARPSVISLVLVDPFPDHPIAATRIVWLVSQFRWGTRELFTSKAIAAQVAQVRRTGRQGVGDLVGVSSIGSGAEVGWARKQAKDRFADRHILIAETFPAPATAVVPT